MSSILHPTPLPLQKNVNRGFLGASTRVATASQLGVAQVDPPPPENEPHGAKGSGPSQQDTEVPLAFMFTNKDCGECSFPVVPTATAILVNGERAGSIDDALFGLYVTPGFGMLPWLGADAQHGYIGLSDYNKLCERLAVQGLKPRALPTFQAAIGVGGAISILKSAEVPIGIQGVSGLVDLNVIDTELPLVLPKSFGKQLGLVWNTTDATATWEELGNRVSDVITLPGNNNAIDILEFPQVAGSIHTKPSANAEQSAHTSVSPTRPQPPPTSARLHHKRFGSTQQKERVPPSGWVEWETRLLSDRSTRPPPLTQALATCPSTVTFGGVAAVGSC